ncbi:LysE family translocator [Tsukamurella pulmonis]|uniref:LysE family translocator n=1 Tax=Tsukamurella pulmonis TaxID=47312 RepID=UPI00244EBC38|nr:LysE family translocator [Tsukamurella pulmonis]
MLCLALSVSPGPDSLLVIKLALERRVLGLAVAVGSAAGSIAWAALVAFGVARLLSENSIATAVLHVAGGLYLIYLGAREFFRHHDAGIDGEPGGPADGARSDPSLSGAVLQGAISCLLNPKVGLFFLLVAPQYASPLTAGSVLVLGLVDAVVATAWLSVLAIGASTMSKKLTDPTVRRRVFRTAGLVIVAIGISVIVGATV